MSAGQKLIPSSSQTVGPYFRIGLEYLSECIPAFDRSAAGVVEIAGQVIDADGVEVPDAMLEFWRSHAAATNGANLPDPTGMSKNFYRVATDESGRFSLVAAKPEPVPFDASILQAPHFVVLVFMRGLLRNLITRVYLSSSAANGTDPVMNLVPVERRNTLIASTVEGSASSYQWNVILQGEGETVFFAW